MEGVAHKDLGESRKLLAVIEASGDSSELLAGELPTYDVGVSLCIPQRCTAAVYAGPGRLCSPPDCGLVPCGRGHNAQAALNALTWVSWVSYWDADSLSTGMS